MHIEHTDGRCLLSNQEVVFRETGEIGPASVSCTKANQSAVEKLKISEGEEEKRKGEKEKERRGGSQRNSRPREKSEGEYVYFCTVGSRSLSWIFPLVG